MAASERKQLEKKGANIDKLPSTVQNLVLSFVGKIGTQPFRYSDREFKDKKHGEAKHTTFFGNVLVLFSYMERAESAKEMMINFLFLINVEETLKSAHHNPCLSIPNLVKDPYGQWIEATPLQAVDATGDCNPPNMDRKAADYGLKERVRSCFKNPAHADKQLKKWRENSETIAEEIMAPIVTGIKAVCQGAIDAKERKEIPDNISWEDVVALPIFLQLAEDFTQTLIPNPNYVVRGGSDSLFPMKIFLKFFDIFKENIPKLGGWWTRPSDVLDAIVYPRLQARSSRSNLSIFRKGVCNVAAGQTFDRLDFTKDTPEVLTGIGPTHFFGLFGDKLAVPGARGCAARMRPGGGLGFAISNLVSSKNIGN